MSWKEVQDFVSVKQADSRTRKTSSRLTTEVFNKTSGTNAREKLYSVQPAHSASYVGETEAGVQTPW